MNATNVLTVIAVACWFIAAFIPMVWASPVNLMALGLFFYGLTKLIAPRP